MNGDAFAREANAFARIRKEEWRGPTYEPVPHDGEWEYVQLPGGVRLHRREVEVVGDEVTGPTREAEDASAAEREYMERWRALDAEFEARGYSLKWYDAGTVSLHREREVPAGERAHYAPVAACRFLRVADPGGFRVATREGE